jgi:predicted HAD superfamily Cof-like phosphohydrolase
VSRSYEEIVREFHRAFDRPVRDLPDLGSPAERVLRVRLMMEELLEFAKAAGVRISTGPFNLKMDDLWIGPDNFPDRDPDLAAMAHELADLQYVVSGTAVQLGIPLQPCAEEIHKANMRKLGPDGRPIVDANGKVRKPEGWEPADVARVLERVTRPRKSTLDLPPCELNGHCNCKVCCGCGEVGR